MSPINGSADDTSALTLDDRYDTRRPPLYFVAPHDWRIGAKIRQDPSGLIGPSTILHASGGWNWVHLSQRLSSSG
jgi:hypothetical protein